MARTPQNLSIGQTSSVDIQTLYSVLSEQVLSPSLVLTNAAATPNTVSVYVNDGSTDFLIGSYPIAGGVGKKVRVLELSTQKMNPLFSIKIQASAATALNHFLSGSITTDES